MRASDAEREAAVERLKTASVEGRLTLGELAERTEAAYSAITRAELDVILSDLPDTGDRSLSVPDGGAKRSRRWFVALLGDTKRRGKWRVDREIAIAAVMGDVVLDLREAEVRGDGVDITATALMGNVKIIVPDGVNVDLDGLAIMGEKRLEVEAAEHGTSLPYVRVKAYALMGDIKVIGDSRADRAKRSWAVWREQWEQLRRELFGDLPPAYGGRPHIAHPPSHHLPHAPTPPQPPSPPPPR